MVLVSGSHTMTFNVAMLKHLHVEMHIVLSETTFFYITVQPLYGLSESQQHRQVH